jgi:ABC-type Fe3+ transport system permease subunit
MSKASKRRSSSSPSRLVFDSTNYLGLVVSTLLIAIGFVAMYLDGQFQGFVSLTVSPLLILAGYGGLIYAILWRPDDESPADEE